MTQARGPILLALLALPAIVLALRFGVWSNGMPGSGLVPLVGAGLLFIAGVASALSPAPLDEAEELPERRRQFGYIAGLLALPPAIVAIGMFPALALFAFATLYLIERLSIAKAIGIAVASMIGAWLLFERLLSVPLPRSALW
jgi:putative tricarboxylic transport membrane protein